MNTQELRLLDIGTDEEVVITAFHQNLHSEHLPRLRELGFREGEKIKCLRTPPFGSPRVFQVSGSVYSVEAEVTQFILVTKDFSKEIK